MIVARVRRSLVERRLVERGDHLVVACSGGGDSVAMTHALSRLARPLGLTLLVASVDHGLRPAAAAEVALVRRLAGDLGHPFQALRVRVGDTPSLQAAARQARYGVLLDLAAEVGARRVAVGHTRDDQAETVLSRILRGCGVEGLAGVDPRRPDGVIRPLIDCRREEVRAHVAHHGLPSVEDPSNTDRRFERVRLRLDLMAALEVEDPAIIEHLSSLADDARALRSLLCSGAGLLLDRASSGPASGLSVTALVGSPRPVRRAALRRWLRDRTGRPPGRVHVEAVERTLTRGGEVLLGRGRATRVVDGRLRVDGPEPEPVEPPASGRLPGPREGSAS